MKILYVSDVYFPRVNGVSTSIATFRDELQKLGHDVHLVAPDYPDEDHPSMRPSPTVTRLPSWRVPFDPEDRLIGRRRVVGLADRMRDQGIELVHIQTPFVAHKAGVELARRLGVPTVETYHTYFEEYLYHYVPFAPRGLMRSLARRFSRSQCNEVDAVVVPSRAMADALRGYGVETPMERIPTGLRPQDFRGGNGNAFRERYRIPFDRPTLVHIGRLAFEKNVDFLLRVLRRVVDEIPEALLVIAGEGPAQASLQKLAAKLRLQENVLFVGYLDRSTDLLDCYRAADAFVFASKTETQGLVVLEAMALSVPVVSTAFMGTRDILEPEQGCLVAEDDEVDFTRKVLLLLRNPELRTKLRREAHRYAIDEWNATVMAKRMAALYERLLAEPRVDDRADGRSDDKSLRAVA